MALPSVILAVFAFLLAPSAGEHPKINLLRTPDQGLQPQALVDSNGVVHLVYLKGDPEKCDVFYARREAGRTSFSVPIRVNSEAASAIAIGTVRGAQFAIGRGGRIHVVWNGSHQSETGGPPLFYARLNQAGTSFETQRNLMTSTQDLDGGGSVAGDGRGNVYAVWHAHAKDAKKDEIHRAVFVAISHDDGKTFAPETRINPDATGVCACCGLKAFADDGGRLGVLYRSANAEGGRDVTLLFSKDRGKTFSSKMLGPWKATSCPMSTMSLGKGTNGTWFGAWEQQGQVSCSQFFAEKADEPLLLFGAEGKGTIRKHPVFAHGKAADSSLLIAWTEGTGWGKASSFAWEQMDLRTKKKTTGHGEGVPAWSFVAVVAEADGGFTILY